MLKTNLRDLRLIQLYLIAIKMKWFYVPILFYMLACQPKEKTVQIESQTLPPGIDKTIAEQVAYAKVGLTKLSDYGFFKGKLSDLEPTEHVVHYDLNTPLFTDYAEKKRFIYLPEGEKIGYKEGEVLDFPIGTILIKNFYYSSTQLQDKPTKIIETRLLLHKQEGWIALPYIWNDTQTEAYLEILGGNLPIVHATKGIIDYVVPDMNQCKSCHDKGGNMTPIGPSVRQLNRMASSGDINQLELFVTKGWIELPDHDLPKTAIWDVDESGTLEERARAYLDINCAHCHNEQGPAKNSGLNLSVFESDPYRLGVNKKPVAAGRGSGNLKYGIVPGKPGESIIVHRMQTTEPGTMMPELGRTIPHDEGVALIEAWIKSL